MRKTIFKKFIESDDSLRRLLDLDVTEIYFAEALALCGRGRIFMEKETTRAPVKLIDAEQCAMGTLRAPAPALAWLRHEFLGLVLVVLVRVCESCPLSIEYKQNPRIIGNGTKPLVILLFMMR